MPGNTGRSRSAAEANGLTVDLASVEDFERIGLSRTRLTVPIEMAVGTNARGETVIKLTTKEAVREPLLDFLLVANWSKGKVLREYTVLLDPPITAPAKSTATVSPLSEKPVPVAKPLTETKPAPPSPAPKPAHAEPKPPVAAATPKAPPKAEAKQAAPPQPPAPKPAAIRPEATITVRSPAGAVRSPRDRQTTVQQPNDASCSRPTNAFYQDNINALFIPILRIPSSDETRVKERCAKQPSRCTARTKSDDWPRGNQQNDADALSDDQDHHRVRREAGQGRCETGGRASGAGAAECRRTTPQRMRCQAGTGRKMPRSRPNWRTKEGASSRERSGE